MSSKQSGDMVEGNSNYKQNVLQFIEHISSSHKFIRVISQITSRIPPVLSNVFLQHNKLTLCARNIEKSFINILNVKECFPQGFTQDFNRESVDKLGKSAQPYPVISFYCIFKLQFFLRAYILIFSCDKKVFCTTNVDLKSRY